MEQSIPAEKAADVYKTLTIEELENEYQSILSIPEARTNVNALTKMSALISEYENRGIEMPNRQYQNLDKETDEARANVVSLLLGVLLVIGGLTLSSMSDSIYYGAIIVGAVMVVRSIF